jgi:hypothetical protein
MLATLRISGRTDNLLRGHGSLLKILKVSHERTEKNSSSRLHFTWLP